MKKVHIRNYILLIFASIFLVGCSLEKSEGESAVQQPVELVIRASQGGATRAMENVDDVIEVGAELAPAADTRTELGPVVNGKQQIYWSTSETTTDKIRVWAKNSADSYSALNGVEFWLKSYNYDYNTADFTNAPTTRVEKMPSGTYTYYGLYPSPEAVSGTTATFTLPTTQSGEYDGSLDWMWATATGPELIYRPEMNSNSTLPPQPHLDFQHLLHLMRISVPTNLLGRDVKRLEITFPQAVVGGTATVDVETGEIEWSGQSTKLTIDLADGNLLNVGGYVWVHIKPGKINGDLKFRAYGADGVPSEAITTNLNNRDFRAGHITPINLTIPTELEPVIVNFSCPDRDSYPNFLGEEATVMHINSGPDALADKNTTITSSGNGVFGVRFYYVEGEVNTDLVGQTINVGFESAHADVSDITFDAKIVSMGSASDSRYGYYALPYLFFEDFNGINEYSYKRTDPQIAPAERPEGVDLSSHGLSKGWTGAHTGGDKNNSAIRIFSRVDQVYGATRTYGRLDSPALSALTNETNVGLYFNYSGGRQDQEAYSPIAVVGYTTTEGAISARAVVEGKANWEDISGYKTIPSISLSGDWNKITQETSCTIEKCKSNYRLSWQVYGNGSMSGWVQIGNGIQWMFLDNIKVSIGSAAKHTGKNYRSFFPNHTN